MQAPSKQEAEDQSAEMIQSRIRGILGRKLIEDMRQEEMIFLGMKRKPKTVEEQENDPIQKMIETELFRKDVQADHWETFISKKLELVEEIKNIQGQDIADEMLMERRNWYLEVRRNGGKVPDSLDKFYAQADAGGAAEDEERKAAEDEEN